VNEGRSRYGVNRWTSRTFLLFAAGGVLLTAAVALRNPVPVFFGLALLLAPFAAAWSTPRALHRVDLAWKDDGVGPEIRVRGTLASGFGSHAGDVSVEFSPPLEVVVEKELTYERDSREVRFATDWRSREPYLSHRLSAVVTWRDPMGLGERVLDGARPALAVERSLPELRTPSSLRLARRTALPGEVRSRRSSMSGEFDALRLAGEGEPARFINWKATARAGRLIANEYEMDQKADLIVLLDLRPTTLGRYYDELLLSLGRAASLGLVRALLRSKFRVGFASFGQGVRAVPLSTGRTHEYLIVQAIRTTRLAARAEDAQRCAIGMRRFFLPGTTTIVVSGWTDDPTMDLPPYLRRMGFPIVTLSPSPLPMRQGTGKLDGTRESLARRVERLERRVRLASLWKYGPVVDWDTYESLEGFGRALQVFGRGRVG